MTAAQAAQALAETKAFQVAVQETERKLVVAADQMLEVDGRWLSKPTSPAHAKEQIQLLQGKTHQLQTAACVFSTDPPRRLWGICTCVRMTMRPLSEDEQDWYLSRFSGEAETVGGYQLEKGGAHLFSSYKGDFFSVLGLPLLPLLAFLRERGQVR